MDVLNLKRKTEFTTEDQQQINDIIQKVAKEEEGFDAKFHDAQVNYARENHMKLTDNKMKKELEKEKEGQ